MLPEEHYRTNNVKVLANFLFGLGGAMFFSYLSLKLAIAMIKKIGIVFGESNGYETAVYMGFFLLGLLMILLFLPIATMFVVLSRASYHLFSTSIVLSDEGIEIHSRFGIHYIPKSAVMHIFRRRSGLTLIWKVGQSVMTFIINKNLFSVTTVESLNNRLRVYNCYSDDLTQIYKIRKKLKLNHILRRNRLEYQLGKLSQLEPAEEIEKE